MAQPLMVHAGALLVAFAIVVLVVLVDLGGHSVFRRLRQATLADAQMSGSTSMEAALGVERHQGDIPGRRDMLEEVHDFTRFEDRFLPAWLERFSVDYESGRFAYVPGGRAALYGSVDVVHVLASVGLLADLTEVQRDAWAAQIDSFQNASTGFYHDAPEYLTGTQPYHGAGEATASLALLGRRPRFNNSVYVELARRGPAMWEAFFGPAYDGGETCYSEKLHGHDIHGCGQIIGSVPSVLAFTTGKDHADFMNWWADWIAHHTDDETGTLCPTKRSALRMCGKPYALYECLGGGMATHGIQLGLAASGYNFPLAKPSQLLNFSLGLQCPDGTWEEVIGSMTLDGIFQVTRSSLQLRKSRWHLVQLACSRMLRAFAKRLNDADAMMREYGNTSHALPNIVAAVAECAQLFPQMVKTRRPWSCCARYV